MPNIWEITGLEGTPTTTTYASTPGNGNNFEIAFAPNGTAYVSSNGTIVRLSNDSPPNVTTLPGLSLAGVDLTVGGMQSNGDAQYLLFNQPMQDGFDAGIQFIDLTASTPTPSGLVASNADFLNRKVIGPDGCLYDAAGTTVYKITNSDGSCSFGKTISASLSLTPTSVSPNPPQGSTQSFTAAFQLVNAPAGTPILFQVAGADPQFGLVNSSNGVATFTYTGLHQGVDTITASATVNGSPLVSNQAVITWGPGSDVTFLTLNQSPTSGTPGQMANLVASLTDGSATPAAAFEWPDHQLQRRRRRLLSFNQRERYRLLRGYSWSARSEQSDGIIWGNRGLSRIQRLGGVQRNRATG